MVHYVCIVNLKKYLFHNHFKEAQKRGYDICPIKSISAPTIENAVLDSLRKTDLIDASENWIESINLINSPEWEKFPFEEKRHTIRRIVKEIDYDANTGALGLTLVDKGAGGRAKDLREIAGWLNMGRTRLFQVANLMLLAPSIQEEIIFAHNAIIEQIPEYKTREIINEPLWESQRQLWSSLLSNTSLKQKR